MAEFRSFLYSNTGTEITFMQGLIDLICGLDSNITCVDANGDPTTAAAQVDGDYNKRATFIFKFGNSAIMALVRWRRNSEGVCIYGYQPNYPSDSGESALFSASNNVSYDAIITRSYFVSYYKNDDVVLLWLGSYNANNINDSICSAAMFKTSNDCFGVSVTGKNPLGATFLGNDSSAIYSPFFQYSENAGHIDFIEKSVFASGGTKVLETQSIKSCSIVPQFSNIALSNNRTFLAIATNAMVETTPESEEEEILDGQSDSVPSMQ